MGWVRLGIGRPPLFAPKQRRPITSLTWGPFLRHEPGGIHTRRRGRSRNRESGLDSELDRLSCPLRTSVSPLAGGRWTHHQPWRPPRVPVRRGLAATDPGRQGWQRQGHSGGRRRMVREHFLGDRSPGYAFHLLSVGGNARGSRAAARAASRRAEPAQAVP